MNLLNILFVLGLVLVGNVQAHPLDIGLMNIRNSGNDLLVKLDLNPAVTAEMKDVFSETLGSSTILINKNLCVWDKDSVQISREETLVTILASAKCAEVKGEVRLEFPFLKLREPSFNLILNSSLQGHERVLSATPASTVINFTIEATSEKSFGDFLQQGIRHIGVSGDQWIKNDKFRLPPGIDHILFLLALVLSGGTFMGLIRLVTGFTLGHTISVTLAAFHIVNVPGHWVEPVIALTIALVAFDSWKSFGIHQKWKITTFIGLIHGLAFAEALVDLNLSSMAMLKAVAGFNIGVELAQAILIALLFPLILLLKKFPAGRKYGLPALSIFIFAIGIYWFVERLIG